MKANYKRSGKDIQKRTMSFTEKQLEEYLNEEWEKKRDEVYKEATKDVSAQILAIIFSTLYKPPYNWREKRLKDLKERIEFTFNTMSTGVLGKEFGTVDCIEFLKREFNIDFDKENPYNETR